MKKELSIVAEKKEKRYVSDNAQLMAEWDWEKNDVPGLCPPSKNRHKIALKNGMNLNNSFIFVKTYAFIPRFT